MSTLRTLSLTAALTAASLAATAAPTVVNFDVDALGAAIAGNTPITSQYAPWGVSFLGLEDGGAVNINAAPDPDGVAVPSRPNALSNCSNASLGCPGNRADIVRISFASPASAISLMLDSLGSSLVTFNLYDAADNLLETVSATSGATFSPYTLVSFTATGVSRIDGLQPNDGWAWAMDDLTFDGSVPLPPTLALLGAALLGMAGLRRRA